MNKPLARCMGGRFCNHQPGTCTATKDAPVPPMAEQEMLTVEQCDREAAHKLLRVIEPRAFEMHIAVRRGEADDLSHVQAFARHRLAATKAADERVAKLEGAIKLALMCTPMIRMQYVGLAGMAYKSVIDYDCGDPWEILRAALAEAGGRGG